MEDKECSYKVLKEAINLCETAKEVCDENEVLNLFAFHYCQLNGNDLYFYGLVVRLVSDFKDFDGSCCFLSSG